MTISISAILPHGEELIDDLYPNMGEKWKKLTEACKNVAEEIAKSNVDLIVIASPHNLRIEEHIGIIKTEWLKGELNNKETNGVISLKYKCDRSFAKELYEHSKSANLPVTLINFGALEGELSFIPLDWGTFIPLWFIAKAFGKKSCELPPVVLITPSRKIPWGQLVELGHIIHNLSSKLNKNIAFIASADQGHAHQEDGPYGFDPASDEYDKKTCDFIKNNTLSKILEFDKDFINAAKPDSFWQELILLGIIEKSNLHPKMCVYECPTYYGMLVALFK